MGASRRPNVLHRATSTLPTAGGKGTERQGEPAYQLIYANPGFLQGLLLACGWLFSKRGAHVESKERTGPCWWIPFRWKDPNVRCGYSVATRSAKTRMLSHGLVRVTCPYSPLSMAIFLPSALRDRCQAGPMDRSSRSRPPSLP
jgi:hypothetical protein